MSKKKETLLDLLMNEISGARVALWGWWWCGHCHETALFLHKKKVRYLPFLMELRSSMKDVFEELGTIKGPMVEFFDDGTVLAYPDPDPLLDKKDERAKREDEERRWNEWMAMLESKLVELGLVKEAEESQKAA